MIDRNWKTDIITVVHEHETTFGIIGAYNCCHEPSDNVLK